MPPELLATTSPIPFSAGISLKNCPDVARAGTAPRRGDLPASAPCPALALFWTMLTPMRRARCRMALSRYDTPSAATKSHRCLRFPSSKGEIAGLIPYRDNGTINSRSYKRPALCSLLLYHSQIRLDPSLPATTPFAGMPAGTHGHPRGRAGGLGGSRGGRQRGTAAMAAGGCGGTVTRHSPGTALVGGTVIESRRLYSAGAGAVIKLTGNAISVLFKLLSAPRFLLFAACPLCSFAPTSPPLRHWGQAAAAPRVTERN